MLHMGTFPAFESLCDIEWLNIDFIRNLMNLLPAEM